MDSFQELFTGGDTWATCERRDIIKVEGGSTSSVDSTSPHPLQHQQAQPIDTDDKDEKKNANSIRGSINTFVCSLFT